MKANLLICDDEENVRRFLEMPFRKRDYNVFTAATGAEAMSILAGEAIDDPHPGHQPAGHQRPADPRTGGLQQAAGRHHHHRHERRAAPPSRR